MIAGPTFGTRSKLKLMNKSFATAGELQKVGLKVCITSDHEINPLRYRHQGNTAEIPQSPVPQAAHSRR